MRWWRRGCFRVVSRISITSPKEGGGLGADLGKDVAGRCD